MTTDASDPIDQSDDETLVQDITAAVRQADTDCNAEGGWPPTETWARRFLRALGVRRYTIRKDWE